MQISSQQVAQRKNRSIIWLEPLDKLLEITKLSKSYTEILKKLGIFTSDSNIRTLKTRIKFENIDDSHIPPR